MTLFNHSSDTLFIRPTLKPLKGTLHVSGSPNQGTKVLIASLLTEHEVLIRNIPEVSECWAVENLIKSLGAEVERLDTGVWRINSQNLQSYHIPAEIARFNRISVLSVSPLLHRFKQAVLPKKLGGDQIGSRPIDFHLDIFKAMGVYIEEDTERFYFSAPQGLKGACIELPFPSVMATENALLSAVLAEGRCLIKNAAMEPEVIGLAQFLQMMGADITYTGERVFIVNGVKKLHHVDFHIMADRNEAVSYACLVLATKGDILLKNIDHKSLFSYLNVIQRMGASFQVSPDGIHIFSPKDYLKSTCIEIGVHPGFMTDWQQPFTALLTQALGVSIVHETIFESRLNFTEDLKQMGAEIYLYTQCLGESSCRFKYKNHYHSAVIKGPSSLIGGDFQIRPDIRSGMALLIASAVAQNPTSLSRAKELLRKYENLLEKLNALGLDISWKH